MKGLSLLLSDKKIIKVFPYMGLCKTSDPRCKPIFGPQGYNLNKFGRGPLDEATYQISKMWAFWFQTKRFFNFSVKKSIFSFCDLDVQWTRTHLNNFEKGPTKNHSCEVWSKSKSCFRRRCHLKILFTDARMDACTHTKTDACTKDEGQNVITKAHLVTM